MSYVVCRKISATRDPEHGRLIKCQFRGGVSRAKNCLHCGPLPKSDNTTHRSIYYFDPRLPSTIYHLPSTTYPSLNVLTTSITAPTQMAESAALNAGQCQLP